MSFFGLFFKKEKEETYCSSNIDIKESNIYQSAIKDHEGWWIGDAVLEAHCDGADFVEISMCLSKQGYLE